MFPALLAAGGAFLGGALGFAGGERANAANARQAQLNRDFQERMRATQYQTAVDDMRKAGLNPALAYQQGGAGTPGGATAQMGNSLAAAGGGAAQAAQTFANIEATMAQIDKTRAETSAVATGEVIARETAGATIPEIRARTTESIARGRRLESENELGIVAAALEHIRSQISSNLASARERSAQAVIHELSNRPLAKRAIDAFRSSDAFKKMQNAASSSAMKAYLDQNRIRR